MENKQMYMPFDIHPVDYVNIYYPFSKIFDGDKAAFVKSDTEVCYPNPEDLQDDMNNPTYILNDKGNINVMKSNPHRIISGSIISRFHLLSYIKFKGDMRSAESHVIYSILKRDVPYVRVGTDWYKLIQKKNRWGGVDQELKGWEKGTITDDHTKNIFKILPTFDDFVIVPDNKAYSRAQDNCYNLYSPFPHQPHMQPISIADIPHSIKIMKHIFGEHFNLGMIYMKCLYELPQQMLPVLVLLSDQRNTGKTTFLDWIDMIFGHNVARVNPKSLTSEFNSSFAKKNILLFEETLVEKSEGMETVKNLTTAKMIDYRDLYISSVKIPFFGKLIMCTNKVLDFMRIDIEETRFWIRYINPIKGERNTMIWKCLFDEIPKFLRYLEQMPTVDTSKDRGIFTADQIFTDHLFAVKEESKSGLRKEIEMSLQKFFLNNSSIDDFYADADDIKNEWFKNDHKITKNYIRKVLANEMKMPATLKTKRYEPFGNYLNRINSSTVAFPFLFKRGQIPKEFNTEDHIDPL